MAELADSFCGALADMLNLISYATIKDPGAFVKPKGLLNDSNTIDLSPDTSGAFSIPKSGVGGPQ